MSQPGDLWRGSNGWKRRPWRCCTRGRGSTGRFEAPPEKAPTESPKRLLHVPIASLAPRNTQFPGGGRITINLHYFAVESAQHHMPKFFKRLLPLLVAPAALLLSQGQAKAILTINIFDDGPNLKITVQGLLAQLPSPTTGTTCGVNGALHGEFNPALYRSSICTGPDSGWSLYPIASATPGFGGTGSLSSYTNSASGSSVSGFAFFFASSAYQYSPIYQSSIGLDPMYSAGSPFFSSATFNDQSLASQGFTATGLVGTWNLVGTSESINVCIGSGPCVSASSAVPAPLPLLGAGAAFGWSRRLRKRIATPLSTPPQA